MGAWTTESEFFNGLIDEVRISNIVCYTTSFTPPTAPFSVDSSTVALWHFEEEAGQIVTDATGHGWDGILGSNTAAQYSDPAWSTDSPFTGSYYPAVTFGLDNGNRTWNESPNILNVMRFKNTVGTGVLTKLELMFDDTSPRGRVRLGVYADDNGKPGSLLLDAGKVEVQNGWVSVDGLSLTVIENTYYWLAFIMDKSNDVRYQTGRPWESHRWATVSYGELPNQYPFYWSGHNNSQYVMRATVIINHP